MDLSSASGAYDFVTESIDSMEKAGKLTSSQADSLRNAANEAFYKAYGVHALGNVLTMGAYDLGGVATGYVDSSGTDFFQSFLDSLEGMNLPKAAYDDLKSLCNQALGGASSGETPAVTGAKEQAKEVANKIDETVTDAGVAASKIPYAGIAVGGLLGLVAGPLAYPALAATPVLSIGIGAGIGAGAEKAKDKILEWMGW